MRQWHRLQEKLNAIWYHRQSSKLNLLLIPCSFLFQLIITLKHKWLHPITTNNPVPVIVVGNLTVGGSGKTPAIIALVYMLQQQGKKPGVISRGYPSNPRKPIIVQHDAQAQKVGDEALLIFKRTGVPVCVCKDRHAAIQTLVKQNIDIILSDDGLQNIHFKHDIELVIYDKILQFGNEKLLPAGPLREPLRRLNQVDLLIEKQLSTDTTFQNNNRLSWHTSKPVYPFVLYSTGFVRLLEWAMPNATPVSADYFHHKKIIAITAIAHPERFFASLSAQNIRHTPVVFPDHYIFQASDFNNYLDCTIIMTEKDAIKCLDFCQENFWCAPLTGAFSPSFAAALSQLIKDAELSA